MVRHLLIPAVTCLLCLQPLRAQNTEGTVITDSEGNKMLPFARGNINIETHYDADYASTLPGGMTATYDRILEDLAAAFSAMPLLNPPVGFEVSLTKRLEVWEKNTVPPSFCRNTEPRTVASLQVSFAPYYRIDNEAVSDFHISSSLYIYINNPHNLAGTPLIADIYPCPQKADDFHGHDIYLTNRRETTVFNFTGKPVFIPVTQEEYIHTLIAYWKTIKNEEQAVQGEYRELYSDEALREMKIQQREEFEQAYRELLKYDKNAAEELKKTFEEIQSQDIYKPGSEEVKAGEAFADEQIARLKGELNAMSAAEKQRQAWYSVNASEDFNNVSGLLPVTQLGQGTALVRINPELVGEQESSVRIVSLHWYLLETDFSDRPRLYTPGMNPGLLTDNKMYALYDDKVFWNQVTKILRK